MHHDDFKEIHLTVGHRKMFREFLIVSYHKIMNNPVKLLHKKISKLRRIYWVGKKIFFI